MARHSPVMSGTTYLTLALLVLAACGGHGDEPVAEPPKPRHHDTVSDSEVGTRLTITASVLSVLTSRACLVDDTDLPPGGLLAIGPTDVHPYDLVTIEGTVALFDPGMLDNTDIRAARRFQGQKVLLTDRVNSWASPWAHHS